MARGAGDEQKTGKEDLGAILWAERGSPRKSGKEGDEKPPSLKLIWDARTKGLDVFPTGHSLTNESLNRGPRTAVEYTSYEWLRKARVKHARSHITPQNAYKSPRTVSHQVGWHAVAPPGQELNYLASPRVDRAKYPRSTCGMTRHMDNMFLTSAQHIMRK